MVMPFAVCMGQNKAVNSRLKKKGTEIYES